MTKTRTWTVALPTHRGESRRVLDVIHKLRNTGGRTATYDPSTRLWTISAPADASGLHAESQLDYCAGRGATVTETTT